ncbi:MAG: RHS repeat-associated core domain-containing protein, partial [Planctomycetia bacterium]
SVATVTRFAGGGVNPIGTSTAAYDTMGRLTGITHAPTASPSIAYGYGYDAASRITSMTTPEGKSSFTLDAPDQLTSARLTGETYAYDKTGNRTRGGTQTGSGNRLLSDGTYRYAYDAEGNRTAKFVDTSPGGTLSAGDTDVTLYAYDQRNRLVAVSHVNAWTSTQAAGLAAFNATGTGLPGSDLELRYTYDYADRRIRKSLDADGQAGAGQEAVSFAAYAGDVRTLEIARPADKIVNDSLRGPIGFLGQVAQRNFYGNGVDEIVAVDRITWNGTSPTTSTFWTFTDHQDSVRDIVSGNAADRGQVVEHRQYDSFGKVVRRTIGPQAGAATTSGVGVEVAFAGRPFESRTGLSDNRARWYEPATGRFVNEDPSGFKGGDANLFRYVGNDPLNQVDPSGLGAVWTSGAKASVPAAGWAALGQGAMLATSGSRPLVTPQAYASLRPPQPAPAAAAAATFSPTPATAITVSGGSAYTPGASRSIVAMQTPPPSPFQRVYRSEVERIDAPSTAGGYRINVPTVPELYGTHRDAHAWTDAAGRTWNTDQGEISAYGPPPPPPTWGQIGEAVFGLAAAFAGRPSARSVGGVGRGIAARGAQTGAESAVNGLKLNKSLASQAQMGEVGTTMAGAGARVPFRGAARVAKEYGGNAVDWVKKTSSSHTARDGATFQTHWVENVRTGQRVEFKTKFPGGD